MHLERCRFMERSLPKDKGKCDICNGTGEIIHGVVGQCHFCNGTGEWNFAAQHFVKNHICQCITLDRKNCPVCHKPCHHDTTNRPGQRIEPGGGGIGFIDTTRTTVDFEEQKTEDIVA